jgi:hypothetical protein
MRAAKGGRAAQEKGARATARAQRRLEQHLGKPGIESDLVARPHCAAPTCRGSGKLKGQVALITGGDSRIGRALAVLFARSPLSAAPRWGIERYVSPRGTIRDAVALQMRVADCDLRLRLRYRLFTWGTPGA